MNDKLNCHIVTRSMNSVETMPPLESMRSPMVAGIAGLLFGAIGIGIYLGWKDAMRVLVLWGFCLILAIPTGGSGLLLGPVFSGIYGYRRAIASNRQRFAKGDLK